MTKFNLNARLESIKNSKPIKIMFTNPFVLSLIISMVIIVILLIIYNKHLQLKTQWKRFLIFMFITIGISMSLIVIGSKFNNKKNEMILDTKLGDEEELNVVESLVRESSRSN